MNASDMVKELIQERIGEEPQVYEPTCILWKADHKDCVGCVSHLACARLISIMRITFKGSMYEPKDFDDFVKTLDRTSELIDNVLSAKTVDEVRSVA